MNRIATLSDKVFAADPNATGDSVEVLGVQHPAEIVNYQSTGATPVILAAGLAVGAIVALALTLIASVRRRRRDLALLKTLGFTARQLAATIAWQASVIAAIAAIIGVPVGIAAGRQLWIFFARNINAVPQPTVPASLILVAVGSADPRQSRCRHPGAHRRAHPGRPRPASRVTAQSRVVPDLPHQQALVHPMSVGLP